LPERHARRVLDDRPNILMSDLRRRWEQPASRQPSAAGAPAETRMLARLTHRRLACVGCNLQGR
jgi:hypothetical protein